MHIELHIDGVTVVDGELDLRSVINRLEEAEEYGLWASSPLTFDQAKELLIRLDTRTLELVRQIVLRGGSITWPHAAQICGIPDEDYDAFYREWVKPLNRVVATVRGEEDSVLIAWRPDQGDWESDAEGNTRFDIDGQALKSLRKVLIG
ncbi:hypothetical protein DC522_31070 [Microvirga sp. KLBC 81]|uniref:hypothetical protein n=1 Tax=Microvirga sp. KLBC 81 TaxID=1862707 RepID=UPI000D51C47E|nr:hypothetical protein [Microvirga sp. KLBC 81]PVE20641.1 hypothetical protein DC522_31070 [Microvirga sp. KLBC 81]